jgi:hypothetical protein
MVEQEAPLPKDEFRLADDFVKYYANNVRFEPNVWDLKIVFGELAADGPNGGSIVEQKIAVRLSWLQAKVMAIFLSINVSSHEEGSGPVRIPRAILGELLHGIAEKDLTLEQMFEEIIKVLGGLRTNRP